jgi:nucleotide-binding universal stress UspA family protein
MVRIFFSPVRTRALLIGLGRPQPLILIKGPNPYERMRNDNHEDPPVGYKTILVHCNDRQRLSRLLDPAARLSAAFGAHLIGLSVSPPITVIPAGMPGTPDTIVIDELAKAYRAKNPAMKAAFHEAAAAQNITAEWREEDAGNYTVIRIVTRHARTADLVIASQAVCDSKGSRSVDIPDRLAIESGRPVLIIPNGGSAQPVPNRVVVGWTARREATRAMFDALPLLKRADKVTVLEVDPDPVQEAMEYTAVCATLARHGVMCEGEAAVSSHGNAGNALLAYCERTKADLLVMGCYGHSRLREFVLGGASRRLLAGMTLPVLMSH